MKNKTAGISIVLILLSGCGLNPTEPPSMSDVEKASEFGTFEETIDRLDNPELIDAWIYRNRTGDINKLAGWIDASGIQQVDNAQSLARAFFEKTGLICGNFSGFVVMCARINGFECGGISYDCHITAWIKFDEKYYFFNNGINSKTYLSWADLQNDFESRLFVEYWDDHLVKINK